MNQSIDQEQLRSAADRFEWVAAHYAEVESVRALLDVLRPLLRDARAGLILQPLDAGDIPGGWHLAEGTFRELRDPNVEQAYGDLSTALQGGWSDQEKRLLAKLARLGRGDQP